VSPWRVCAWCGPEQPFLATGEMPNLADPFGDKLLYNQEGGKPKIWSIGSDGTNQNGVGNWQGRPDMVLEISR
jgi:hypothetical protein